jgi:hypothetical protein
MKLGWLICVTLILSGAVTTGAFADEAGDEPYIEASLSLKSFDERQIVAETVDHHKMVLPRKATAGRLNVDSRFRKYKISLEDWSNAVK